MVIVIESTAMITDLFCIIDDFMQIFTPQWESTMLDSKERKRNRPGNMSPSEIMAILIGFHQSNYRTFKYYYTWHIQKHYKGHFPRLLSYTRFVAASNSVIVPLCAFMHSLTGEQTGIYFVASTLLQACHVKREKQNKVFQ